ncbi:MAG: sigma-70 family RNA polymerase sigma factor [Patescibacteria group bacterium]|nr:sigma-70 family RNA polymerase sigma factor [Patescibacteria group bacterium]
MLDGEEKLIHDAVKGDSSAFGLLYDHYQPMIYRFVAVKVGRREEAEDITHQVFLSAWQNIRRYEHRGHPFSSWLYRIARNRIIDHYRSSHENVSLEGLAVEEIVVAPQNAASDISAQLEMERVLKALHELKPEYQDVIILRFIEDLSIKETAAAMKKTEGAVKLMQHRAMAELRKILEE